MSGLNARARAIVDAVILRASELNIERHVTESGGTVLDFGVAAAGGIEAGTLLAQAALAGLASVTVEPAPSDWPVSTLVRVTTDSPLNACMGAQYAGWPMSTKDGFFAMGSGPMRAVRGREPVLERYRLTESSPEVIGVLESDRLPPESAFALAASECRVSPESVTLLIAPVTSLAGTIQVVARSVETALHKLFELEFDLATIRSGFGTAPLPPPARDGLGGIGRTNDSILYGAAVTLWVACDDAAIEGVGESVPSQASEEFGASFLDIFERNARDFYRIDPMLFSPAQVHFVNLNSGNCFSFGRRRLDLLSRFLRLGGDGEQTE